MIQKRRLHPFAIFLLALFICTGVGSVIGLIQYLRGLACWPDASSGCFWS